MQQTVAWPLVGLGAQPPQADDLDLTFACWPLQFPARDMQEISPPSDAGSELAIAPAKPPAFAQAAARSGKWPAAVVVSCILHGAVAAFFLISPSGTFNLQDSEQSEGSDQSGDKVAGSALDRDPAAINVTLVPKPQPTRPEPAKAIRPAPPTQPSEPTRKETAQPPEVSPEPARQPDVLVADSPRPDDQSVVASTEVPVQPATQETSVVVPDQPPIPSARPTPAAPSPTASETDNKRGTADGQDRLAQAASKGKKQKEAGSEAAEYNYRGDVIRKLSRVNRAVPPSVQLTAVHNAVVRFVIGSHGGIDDLRILQTSGSSNFDQVALGIVRKAAPFPPIPSRIASKSLEFEAEIGPF